MENVKDENYRNLGGINVRFSLYQTKQAEFLNLVNYCFYRPGALTKRPGQEITASLIKSAYPTQPTSTMEYLLNNGDTYIVYDSGQTLYTFPNTPVGGSLTPSPTMGLVCDYEIQNDDMYICNGHAFKVFHGTIAIDYSAKVIENAGFVGGVTFTTNIPPANGQTVVLKPGFYHFWLTGVRGETSAPIQYGAASNLGVKTLPVDDEYLAGVGRRVSLGVTTVGLGSWLFYGITSPNSGYSYLAPQWQVQADMQLQRIRAGLSSDYVLNAVKSPTLYAFGQSTYGTGTTVFGVAFDHFTLSASWESQFPLTSAPRFLETYNNMLFMTGFSTSPTQVVYSEVGEPQRIKEENNFLIVTKDNEPITGCVFFQDSLLFFKRNSIHELVGTSPQDLTLRTVNLEYGALNNESIVVFQNRLCFVDEKGICEYNAANIKIISEPIETLLDETDKGRMKALHYKDRNEIWFCVDGGCYVYDYLVNAWTRYSLGFLADLSRDTGAAVLPLGVSTSTPHYWATRPFVPPGIEGASFWNLVRFNPDVGTDFGEGMTLVAKTRFHKRMGESTEEMWRRLFIDCESEDLAAHATINYYPNYGDTSALTNFATLSTFQVRKDFGVPAKSLAVEIIIKSSSEVTLNGYTIESRYLRPV